MLYHLTIAPAYWPAHVPNWAELTPEQQRTFMQGHLAPAETLLKKDLPEGHVFILITSEGATVSTVRTPIEARKVLPEVVPSITGTAIQRIAQERQEQLEKHGYGPSHDDQFINSQLAVAAYVIQCNNLLEMPRLQYPFDGFEEIMLKPLIERHIIAATFLAAEIDRLLRIEATTQPT